MKADLDDVPQGGQEKSPIVDPENGIQKVEVESLKGTAAESTQEEAGKTDLHGLAFSGVICWCRRFDFCSPPDRREGA